MTTDIATPQKTPESGTVVPLKAQDQQSKREQVTTFVRDHPLICVAGGLAAGVLMAAMLPRRTKHRIADRASHLAELVSAATVMLGQQAINRAEAAGEAVSGRASALAGRAERVGNSALGTAERWGEMASGKAARLMNSVDSDTRSVRDRIAGKAGEIRDRVRH